MISNTKLTKRLSRKKHSEIVETVLLAKKAKAWNDIAKMISGSRRKYSSVNLKRIEEETSEGDTIVIPGKVLGTGNVSKKVRVCAISFSDSAREKLKNNKGEIVSIREEMKKNPKAEGIRILK